MVFLRSSERDPVFNGVARRSARFIPFPRWALFFSTVLSRHFPRTDRLRNWVVKAERDMIVYQRRTGSSPCIWRRANLGALTHPTRCHRGRHLVSDFVGPPSWCRGGCHLGPEVVGGAILDRKS